MLRRDVEATRNCFLSLAALENSDNVIDPCGMVLIILSILFMIVTLPISIWMCIKVSFCLYSMIPLPWTKSVKKKNRKAPPTSGPFTQQSCSQKVFFFFFLLSLFYSLFLFCLFSALVIGKLAIGKLVQTAKDVSD